MTSPAIDTIQTYGGAFIDAAPVENPQTDLGAGPFTQMSASVAMGTHTFIRGWVQILTSATTPTIIAHDALWGNGVSVTPTLVRTAIGNYSLTIPATINDELGVVHSTNIRGCWGNVNASGAVTQNINVARNTATQMVISISNSGAASDIAGTAIDIFYF